MVALGAMFFFKQHSAPVPGAEPPPAMTNAAVAPVTPPPSPPAITVTPAKTPSPEEHHAVIAQETERLAQWSMNDDQQSLSNILGDLTSPEKEIRMAAIDAAKQFGSTNAIPVLKGMAANTDNPEEAAALLEAVDFLELPDFVFPGTVPPQQ